jgi:hypothetical protein
VPAGQATTAANGGEKKILSRKFVAGNCSGILKRVLEQEVSTGLTNIKKGHWNNALCFANKRRTSISIQE